MKINMKTKFYFFIFLFFIVFYIYVFNIKFLNNKSIENFEETSEKQIPKIIWSFWDKGAENAHHIVKKCINNWQKLNPTWKINILNDNNYLDYIDKNEISGINFKDLFPQKKADLIRIILISKYGGVWLDGSTILLEPLDWIQKKINNTNKDSVVFSADHFTTNKEKPVLENWFISAVPNSHFINLWKNEFITYLRMGHKPYMETFPKDIDFQKFGNSQYLTMHAGAIKIMHDKNLDELKLLTIPSSEGPFGIQMDLKWIYYDLADFLATNTNYDKYKYFIKIRGYERYILDKYLNNPKNKIQKNSILNKFLEMQ